MKHLVRVSRVPNRPAQAQRFSLAVLNYWFCWGYTLANGGEPYAPKCGEDFELT